MQEREETREIWISEKEGDDRNSVWQDIQTLSNMAKVKSAQGENTEEGLEEEDIPSPTILCKSEKKTDTQTGCPPLKRHDNSWTNCLTLSSGLKKPHEALAMEGTRLHPGSSALTTLKIRNGRKCPPPIRRSLRLECYQVALFHHRSPGRHTEYHDWSILKRSCHFQRNDRWFCYKGSG